MNVMILDPATKPRSLARTSRLGLIAALALWLLACSQIRMAPPPDMVDSSDVLLVSKRSRSSGLLANEGFQLGPYTVSKVDRDWNRSKRTGIGPWSKQTKTTGFTYRLTGATSDLKGACESESNQESVTAFNGRFVRGSGALACRCEGASGSADLVLSTQGNQLGLDGATYRVQPVFDRAGGGKLSTPTGFRIDGAAPVAAAEVIHPGQVWLARPLDDAAKARVTCVLVGLMLYKPPRD